MWAIPCACIFGRWHSVQHHAVVSRLTGRRGLVVIESFASVATSKFLWRPWRQCVRENDIKSQCKLLFQPSTSKSHAKIWAALPAARAIPSFLFDDSNHPSSSMRIIVSSHFAYSDSLIIVHYLVLILLMEKYVHVTSNLGLT